MTHSQKAQDYFLQGYNCAQSVFTAFIDVTHVEEKEALKISAAFGGGIGRLRETCGAVSGMALVISHLKGYTTAQNQQEKSDFYALIQRVIAPFEQKAGSFVCRDLLKLLENRSTPIVPLRDEKYYKERPCLGLVVLAAQLLDEWLQNEENI